MREGNEIESKIIAAIVISIDFIRMKACGVKLKQNDIVNEISDCAAREYEKVSKLRTLYESKGYLFTKYKSR